HINEESLSDPDQFRIVERACQLAAHNGSTYFIFDRDEVTLSACCRLRTTITDNRMLRHPESMRFCGFQNVTINIPQAAFRASRKGRADLEGLLAEIDATMELCAQAHLEKRSRIEEMMSEPGRPLYQIGRPACDEKPYVDPDKSTYIIGLIGINDAVQFLTGHALHESRAAQEMGLTIVAHMYLKAKKLSRKYKMKFSLEESPAESAARRLAKTDMIHYRDEAVTVVKGSLEDDSIYYTNSIHLAADAPVSLVERIREQAQYHCMIESGAIVHAFVGEEKPSPDSILYLVMETFKRTQCAQLTISPEFTYCYDCFHQERGLHERCTACGSTRVFGESRVVGYFSKIENWNRSKRFGELAARRAGRYRIETAVQTVVETAEADAVSLW
nr:anaerobic ribonucleoside-triphosphate reductase [bacterium]